MAGLGALRHALLGIERIARNAPADQDVTTDGFARAVIEPQGKSRFTYSPRWSPDGTRFAYLEDDDTHGSLLMLANAAGGHPAEIAKLNAHFYFSWSPDGRWLGGLLDADGGKKYVAKIKASPGSAPVILAVSPSASFETAEWSPAGNEILYPAEDGLWMVSVDGGAPRRFSSHRMKPFHFSKDGRHVFGIFHNVAGSGGEWQLYSVDVSTGAEKMIGAVDLPAAVQSIAGFSIHPDGKRALMSISKQPFDIWMLEGFDQPVENWLARLFRR